MSPIDDELRRVLAAHADDTALQTDPLAGIEREAKSIRRRRTSTAVLGAALSVALVALVVPALRTSLDTDTRKDRVAGTPTPLPSDEAFDNSGARPVNAYPWHRDVSATDVSAVLQTWRSLHPNVKRVGGQGLWSGSVPGLTGHVVALQVWPYGTGEDAHSVFAVVDEHGARIFSDGPTFFNEQRPGDGPSITKYDVNRTTYEAAAFITSIFDSPRETEFWVVVTPPSITSVKLAIGKSVVLSTTSGGAGIALAGEAGGVTTLRGTTVASRGQVGSRPVSLLAGDPTAWPTQGDSALGASAVYSGAYRELQNRFNGRVGGATVLWAGRDGSHVVALVIGEYATHGYSAATSAYVAGAWVGDDQGDGRFYGLHDLGFGIASVDVLVPASSPLGRALVLAVGGVGWGVAYTGTDAEPVPSPTSFSPFVVTTPTPGRAQIVVANSVRGTIASDLGRGKGFPDI